MKATPNPLLKPLKNLMKAASVYQSIPGFESESLNSALEESKKAIINEAKTKIPCSNSKK